MSRSLLLAAAALLALSASAQARDLTPREQLAREIYEELIEIFRRERLR